MKNEEITDNLPLDDFQWDEVTPVSEEGLLTPEEPEQKDVEETPEENSIEKPKDEPIEPEEPVDDNYARNLYDNFKELGLISTELREDETLTEDGLVELMKTERETAIKEGVDIALDEFIGNIGEDERQALTFIKKGGKIMDFMNLYSDNAVKLDGDITNEAYQDEIIKYYEKKYNKASDEEVMDILDAFTSSGKKETRAKNYLNNLNTRIKEEQDRLIKQQAELTAKRQLIEQKDLDTVKTTINGLKTVKNKTELINFLTQKEVELQDGRKLSKFQYELGQTIADPVKRVMLAQLLQSDFDFSKIEKQAETKVIRQFKENLLKKTPSRQQTRNEMSWEDFKS